MASPLPIFAESSPSFLGWILRGTCQSSPCQPWALSASTCLTPTESECVAQSCPILWDTTDCSPLASSVHGNSLGKNTGVDSHSPFQGIFPTQGSIQGSPALQADSLLFEPRGKPWWILKIQFCKSHRCPFLMSFLKAIHCSQREIKEGKYNFSLGLNRNRVEKTQFVCKISEESRICSGRKMISTWCLRYKESYTVHSK